MTLEAISPPTDPITPNLDIETDLAAAANDRAVPEGDHEAPEDDDDFPCDEEGRPTIDVTKPLDRIVDRCVRLLAEDPMVFQKHTELVRVVSEEQRRVKPRPFKNSQMRLVLARRATWTKEGNPTHPPSHVAKCIIERTAWERIRILRAVTPFPAMAPDGSLPSEAGYDAATKTYFTGDVRVDVPAQPSREEVLGSVATLFDIVGDFPFADEEHKAAWLAGLLTPLARYAHDGNAPMTIVQANGPRVGKTTLVQVVSEIVHGSACPVITFTKNEDETRKRILSFLRVARSLVLVDNVIGQFGGQNVNALTTSRTFEDRVLGKSVIIEAINDTSWYVTANNITLAPDTAERCLNVRLHSEEEKPQLRTDFKYPFLFETVRERRGQLLSAALTIIKAYIVAGMPDQKLPSWGGFEPWSRLIRGAVVFAGLPDPARTRLELEEQADVQTDEKAALVAGLEEWQRVAGIAKAAKAIEILEHVHQHPGASPRLRQALEDIAGVPGSLPDSKTLSRHLRDARSRNYGGLALYQEADRKNGHRWRVEHLHQQPHLHIAGAQVA